MSKRPALRKLYLRIWLAIVGSIVLLSLILAWAWQQYAQEREVERQGQPPRPVVIYDSRSAAPLHGQGSVRWARGQGTDFEVQLNGGERLTLHLAPRATPPSGLAALMWRLRPPYGFLWVIALAGLAVMLALFPIARRLTARLERLQQGVERWGQGALDQRIRVVGNDEISDLARHFNQAADQIEALVAEQARLVQSQKSLLANASHELRSPLARIRMALELAGDGNAPPGPRREILRNVAELDALVEEILLASRLDAPHAQFAPPEAVDLVGLLAEECARINANLTLPPGLHEALVMGDARLLRRAIRNLLENAVRHGGRQSVHAHLHQSANGVEIHVDDDGPGVPLAQRERIFEPFYRLPGAAEHEGSVGLGLALVRSITRHHGGSVRCVDAPKGRGARFVLCLPS